MAKLERFTQYEQFTALLNSKTTTSLGILRLKRFCYTRFSLLKIIVSNFQTMYRIKKRDKQEASFNWQIKERAKVYSPVARKACYV